MVFQGGLAALLASNTATGQWLSGRRRLESATRAPCDGWRVSARGGPVVLQLGAVNVVTGPSGSGKSELLSSLAREAPEGMFRRVVRVEPGSRRGSRRSNAATWTGLWDVMRPLLAATRAAQVRGLTASSFSLNVAGGRCERCLGQGTRRLRLELLPDLYVECDVCRGRRFREDVLQVRWKGLPPDALLDLSADDALKALAGHPRLELILAALRDVGLGYLVLGQATRTLSGGELQRLKLARELIRANRREGGALIVADDPTGGLHMQDVERLLNLLRRLADEGHTVVASSHVPAFVEAADHAIHLSLSARLG